MANDRPSILVKKFTFEEHEESTGLQLELINNLLHRLVVHGAEHIERLDELKAAHARLQEQEECDRKIWQHMSRLYPGGIPEHMASTTCAQTADIP